MYIPDAGSLVKLTNYKEDGRTRFLRVLGVRDCKEEVIAPSTRADKRLMFIARSTYLMTAVCLYTGAIRSFYLRYVEKLKPMTLTERVVVRELP